MEQLKKNLKQEVGRLQDVRDTLTKAAKSDNSISLQLAKVNSKKGMLIEMGRACSQNGGG